MTDTVAPAAAGETAAPARRVRSGSERRQATRSLAFRLKPEQRERLDALAAERGIGPSSLVKEVALSLIAGAPALPRRSRQRPAADPQLLRECLAQLGKTGSNANQIARALNEARQAGKAVAPRIEALERFQSEMAEVRALLVKALG